MKSNLRNWLFRIWYWYVNKIDRKGEILFMNFGYADSAGSLAVPPRDEGNRYSIQLYHHLASAVDLKSLDVTEIGCGRGGGLAYIMEQCSPASAVGIDLDRQAIAFCNRHYALEGLSFLQGDAQNIPLDNNSCDVVINVESSHRYPDMRQFLGEVYRILRAGGYFLLADFRYDYEIPALQKELQSSGLIQLKEEFITGQVVNALELDDGRKRKLVEKLAPRFLHKTALNFAGAIGSRTYDQFVSREYVYFSYIFQKKQVSKNP
jgi:ubiquinone/menaquinone biosynthesis C-methylase UbiE